MPSFIGSIDQGTTSSRFLIFDSKGNLVTYHQVEFPQYYPNPGWIEHDPTDLLETVYKCIEEALKKFVGMGNAITDIKAIGITNQRETTLVWDKQTGKPLCNAIVWCDVRTHDLVHELTAKSELGANALKEVCGLPLSTYFSAVKLKWLLENVPAVKEAHENDTILMGNVDTWLIYNLTGGINGGMFLTDATNASRTMLMDIKKLQWSEKSLKFFGIKKCALPQIYSSSEKYGDIKITDLAGIPITGVLGDQQSALVGQKCFNRGEAKNTYGTGCFMLFNTGTEPVISKSGLLTTVGYKFGKEETVYALEGSIAVAGSAIKWVRDNLCIINETHEINNLAASVKDTGGVYFVTAFSGLFAPYWRDDARGCIVGITQYTNKSHIARATLEAACFQTRAILDAMNNDSGHPLTSLKVDGGMTNSDICMQIQADILRINVDRPAMKETTALGAAIAAGLAVGIWKSLSELDQVNCKDRTTFYPQMSEEESEQKYKAWQKAVEKSLDWA
ncbi:3279_t:CDS:2 [Funneliformis geosporum]|uniref:glycerol kinase n=1 Tax=Funneliformis geosporum TaxID=1117311 RepID=A0A9W4WMD8_9GLOM|nr:3279_t:CDS:2 [Funneliformis geosporum]CAI2172770.1 185_t:CDS:2 [Funneliformis geosporum]